MQMFEEPQAAREPQFGNPCYRPYKMTTFMVNEA